MLAHQTRQPIQSIILESENTRRKQIGDVIQHEIRSLATNAPEARIKVKEIEKNIESCQKQIQDTERIISESSSSSSSSSTESMVVYDSGTAQKRVELQVKLDNARDLLQTLTLEHSVLLRAIAYEEQQASSTRRQH